eukprot:m51a1_g1827 putative domain containing protein (643) ;mRNA; f:524975-528094
MRRAVLASPRRGGLLAPPRLTAQDQRRRAKLTHRLTRFCDAVRPVISSMLSSALAFEATAGDEDAVAAAVGEAKRALGAAVEEFYAEDEAAARAAAADRARAAHYKCVLDELVHTEMDFARDLRVMDTVWKPEVGKTGMLEPSELASLFGGPGSLDSLMSLSSELASALASECALDPRQQQLGAVFLRLMPKIREAYVQWSVGMVQGMEVLANSMKVAKFREWVDRFKQANEQTRGLDIQAYVIKPTQRITKYPLLLVDLIKSSEKGAKAKAPLEESLRRLQAVLQEINEATRQRETELLVDKLLPIITWSSSTSAVDIKKSRCRLIGEGKQGSYCLLFDNCFIAFDSKDGKMNELVTIPTKELLFEETPEMHITIARATAEDDGRRLVMSFAGENDQLRWSGLLKDVQKLSESAPPLEFLKSSDRSAEGSPVSRAKTTGGMKSGLMQLFMALRVPSRDEERVVVAQSVTPPPQRAAAAQPSPPRSKSTSPPAPAPPPLAPKTAPVSPSLRAARSESKPELPVKKLSYERGISSVASSAPAAVAKALASPPQRPVVRAKPPSTSPKPPVVRRIASSPARFSKDGVVAAVSPRVSPARRAVSPEKKHVRTASEMTQAAPGAPRRLTHSRTASVPAKLIQPSKK